MHRSVRALSRTVLALLLIAVSSLVVLVGPAAQPVLAAGASEVTSFGTNPGALKMFRYVPAGLPAGAPLVVAMHGCTQSAAAYDEEPGWVALAERWKFALVLPEQQTLNHSSRCFNWFQSGDITRGSGEALSIKQMVDRTQGDLGSDTTRTFVTGLSAGGAMTAVMLAAYPEVFAGGAVVAGIPFRCATTVVAAYGCLDPGVDKTPQAWGDLVRAASPFTGTRPTVQVWHGTSDTVVRPVNMTELVEQWTDVAGTDATADTQDTVAGYPHSVYRDASGRAAVELYSITGMGHGTPVDPGTGPTQCGTAGAYILDVDICSSYYIAQGWGLDTSDGTAPSASLTAPSDGAAVSGLVTVSADAADAMGVARVELLVDSRLLATDTTAPYATTWDTAAAANGTHTLLARAYDTAGNVGQSSAVTVTVSGGTADTTPPTVVSLAETFSDLDGSGDLFDSPGWTPGGWDAGTDSASPGSGTLDASAHGLASSGAGCVGGLTTEVLSRTVTLGSAPVLSYARRLALEAAVNTSTTASFRVLVDGTAVDTRSVTYAGYRETAWTARDGIDLTAWADQTVTLAFEVSASSNVCLAVTSEAWVDDVLVENPSTPAGGGTPSTSATFTSRAGDDGYVKADADGSSAAVGAYESSYGLAIGRGSDSRVNRSLLSFDTSAVPDGATLTSAVVTLTYASGSGDPWASPAGNTLVLDVKDGCFGLCSTEAADWGSAPTAAAVADVAAFTGGTQQSSAFDAAGLAALNRTGITQVRLRYTATPTSTAYVFVRSGASATLALTWQ